MHKDGTLQYYTSIIKQFKSTQNFQRLPWVIQGYSSLSKVSKGFQNACRMFQNVPECIQNVSESMQNVPESMQNVPECMQYVPECMQNVPECMQDVPERSKMHADDL